MYQGSPEHLANATKALEIASKTKTACSFCNKEMVKSGLKQHESSCYLNPNNRKPCPVCSSPIKNYRENTTCSVSCANTYFRSGPSNSNWKDSAYVTTCFHNHDKKCVVCGEDRIVEVHHLDENRDNNEPSNLIPLCPTHHRYWHSRFKYLIEQAVLNYQKRWLEKQCQRGRIRTCDAPESKSGGIDQTIPHADAAFQAVDTVA